MIDPQPSTKTGTTATAGALVLVIGFVCNTVGLEVPGDVLAAAVFLAMTAVAWFMPARRRGRYERGDDGPGSGGPGSGTD